MIEAAIKANSKPWTEERRKKIMAGMKNQPKGRDCKISKAYVITTPKGEEFYIKCLSKFTKMYIDGELKSRSLSAVVQGQMKHHEGYKCRYYDKEKDSNLFEYVY